VPNTHYNLGLAYLAQKQYQKANLHAQKAYQADFPYPALRDKLRQAGAWQPLPPSDPARSASDRVPDPAEAK
jgi:hypothetical protein